MSTELIILLAILGAGLLGVTALCWRMVGGLHGHHALDSRERERERRDHFHLIEKLIERRDVPDIHQLDLAHRHGAERMQRVASDAETEKEGAKATSKTPATPFRKPGPQRKWDDMDRALRGG